jgi:biotin operon repressor
MSSIFRTEFRDLQDAGGNTTKASTAKFVCIALADHANDEGEGAYPSIEKISYKTNLSRTAVINALDALKHNGILLVAGESKYRTVNYTVNPSCFSQDSQPALLVNPLDSEGQPEIPSRVNPLDPNHPLTINESSSEQEISKAQAFHERREELQDDLAENSLEAAVILGKPLGKAAQKIKDSLEFHTMICAELARLPYNFEGDVEREQESFRKFLKEKSKAGQELKTWVDWWMSDEWRIANPPWKLTTIKVKWLEAFKTTEKPTRPEYQKFVPPPEEEFIPNPKAKK